MKMFLFKTYLKRVNKILIFDKYIIGLRICGLVA